ncbi:unnamed protein product [Peniophora sp. CBMAI 1063]|nr:unnamed protein product [Peniophora sp. CBMAI 1063]
MSWSDALSAIAALAFLLAIHYIARRHFFKSSLANLPGPGGYSWLRGHTRQLYDRQGWDFHLKEVPSYGSAVRLRGYLGEDILYVTDPVALRAILVKEHGDGFDEPPMIIERNKLLWGPGLLSSTGLAHKRQRTLAFSAFSEKRIKSMTPMLYHVVEATLRDQVRFGPAELDMMHWASRCALECIAQAGMGVSFDALKADSHPNEYMVAAKQLIPLSFSLQAFMRAIPLVVKLGSPKFLGALTACAPIASIRKLRDISYFLFDTNAALYRRRKREVRADDKPAAHGNDALSFLIHENNNGPECQRNTDEEMISQIGTLMFAGQDTTSVALARILHVLALDQRCQDCLREELRSVGDHHISAYEVLSQLPYLDAVCKETLRFYSPVTQLHRVSRRDVTVPLGRPIIGKDGTAVGELLVEAGTFIVIGATAVNRDPLIWGPTSEQWIPERWLDPLPKSVTDAHLPSVYGNLMSFMGGGRSCIGFKFAEAEIKVVLHVLISRFKFEPPASADIQWCMYNFATPTVDGKPSLPLKVTMLPL